MTPSRTHHEPEHNWTALENLLNGAHPFPQYALESNPNPFPQYALDTDLGAYIPKS